MADSMQVLDVHRNPQPPQPDHFVRNGWILYGTLFIVSIAAFPLGLAGEMLLYMLHAFVMLIMIVLIYRDAKGHDLDRLKNSSLPLAAYDRYSPTAWAVLTFLVFPIAVPLYLFRRDKLVQAAFRTITENRYR